MKRPLSISAALASAVFGLFLFSCDGSPSATASPGSDASGSLAFSLPAATRVLVGTSSDSLKVELHQGSLVHTAAAALDGSIRVVGLEPGRWSLQVGVYSVAGILHWYGTDSVTVAPGETTRADVTLRKAKGSVDVVIHLEDSSAISTDSLLGKWYLHHIDSTLRPQSASLRFGNTGNLSGLIGCNSISGSWAATDSILHIQGFLETMLDCMDTATGDLAGFDRRVQDALLSTHAWKVASGMLYLYDSTGRIRLQYGRNEPNIMIPPRSDSIDAVILVDSTTDTAGLHLSNVRVISAEVRDSFVLLTLQLPHPNLQVRLIPLAPESNPACPTTLDTIPSDSANRTVHCDALVWSPFRNILVVGVETNPSQPDIQMVKTIHVAVPWTSVAGPTNFLDRAGNSIRAIPPDLPM